MIVFVHCYFWCCRFRMVGGGGLYNRVDKCIV